MNSKTIYNQLNILSIFIFVVLLGCTPPVVFNEAYPITASDLDKLPTSYQGVFICESDSSLVVISDHDITLRKEQYFILPLKYVDEREECLIAGNQMYVTGREACIPLEYINDSIVKGTVVEHDTLFIMDDNSVARIYEGHVVLSKELREGQWGISLLSLENNGDIVYRAITDKTKLKNIRKITEMKDITGKSDKKSRYKVKPTMTEFDEMISDEKIFIECEYLTRVVLEESFDIPKIKMDKNF